MKEKFIQMSVDAPEAQPLLDHLFAEYEEIYGDFFASKGAEAAAERKEHHDRERYEAAEKYLPPTGLFIVLKRDDEVIAMGAYKRYDDETAELKRIWSHRNLRKQGLAAKVVKELEKQALQAGYNKIFLTTGFKQIPAVKLYLSLGYEPQFELTPDFNFEKYIGAPLHGGLPFRKILKQEEIA
ncbi:GNAT family N-acetyltransferase [Acinetobacter qingfengensis]|uniref:GNAT family N-acetyltransferase n=1 Tax=Acinetobacter qingfengensis TaxID=1262585 RepID=A0A1E7R3Z9_9GAMM|nr:GNAT family N-acetyltransferase [Acinetobacter qingfengensis]KAA8733736.1 GNAT family N-acetyltransferase [Acinetobacter qingfengensis]OEY94040.1 GNAT family N-acetyltransferase [Acinetobacter qingfengensis]